MTAAELLARLAQRRPKPQPPAVRTPKLPYLRAGAECIDCAAAVSGDWGLVPDRCEACDTARCRDFYYAAKVRAEFDRALLLDAVEFSRRCTEQACAESPMCSMRCSADHVLDTIVTELRSNP